MKISAASCPGLAGLLQGAGEALHHVVAVGQAGQRVVQAMELALASVRLRR
jgi:hypothetical protein